MNTIFRKLLVGKVSRNYLPKLNPIQKSLLNIKAIWNNDHQDDNGIEKIVRLFLSCSQLLFPGIYIKYLACKRGYEYQDLALDFYVAEEAWVLTQDLFQLHRSGLFLADRQERGIRATTW